MTLCGSNLLITLLKNLFSASLPPQTLGVFALIKMSKELPYFKFFSDQWLGKKITLEPYELQGVFINVCAIYWANDCDIKIATLQKRYGEAIDLLISEGYIKSKDGIAKISFLDSQWNERYKIHKELSNSGKAGAKARWDKYREANNNPNGVAIKNDMAIRKDKIRKDNIDYEKFFDENLQLPYIIENDKKVYGTDSDILIGGMSKFAIEKHLESLTNRNNILNGK